MITFPSSRGGSLQWASRRRAHDPDAGEASDDAGLQEAVDEVGEEVASSARCDRPLRRHCAAPDLRSSRQCAPPFPPLRSTPDRSTYRRPGRRAWASEGTAPPPMNMGNTGHCGTNRARRKGHLVVETTDRRDDADRQQSAFLGDGVAQGVRRRVASELDYVEPPPTQKIGDDRDRKDVQVARRRGEGDRATVLAASAELQAQVPDDSLRDRRCPVLFAPPRPRRWPSVRRWSEGPEPPSRSGRRMGSRPPPRWLCKSHQAPGLSPASIRRSRASRSAPVLAAPAGEPWF